jgi:hypothetical protein
MHYREIVTKIKHRIWMRATPNERELEFFRRTKTITHTLTRFTPGVECIALVNSTALCATHSKSDIDLLIVVRPWYLMLTRVILTLLLKYRGELRRWDDDIGKFCLSFFLDTGHLDMSKIALDWGDPYLALWTSRVIPVAMTVDFYERWQASNQWIWIPFENPFPQAQIIKQPWYFSKFIYPIIRCVDLAIYGMYSLVRTITKLNKTPIKTPWGIIINRWIQKLHPDDKRMEWKNYK